MTIYRLQEHPKFKFHPTLLRYPVMTAQGVSHDVVVLPNPVETYQIGVERETSFFRVTGPEGIVFLGVGPVSVVLSPAPF